MSSGMSGAPEARGRPPVARDVPGVADAERAWSAGLRRLTAVLVVGFLVELTLVVAAVGAPVLWVIAVPLAVLLFLLGIAVVVLSHESQHLGRLLATSPWRELPLWSIPARAGGRPQLVLGEQSGPGSRHSLRRMTSGTGLRSGHRLDALAACAGGTLWVCGDGRTVVVSPPAGASPVLARLVRLPDVVGGSVRD